MSETVPPHEQPWFKRILKNAYFMPFAVEPQQKQPKPNESMSVKEVADELGVSKETVYGLCADGTMPHTRVGRRITITPAQLAEYRRQAER